nr:hypothetical protein [Tanacetum cinerariifolium]
MMHHDRLRGQLRKKLCWLNVGVPSENSQHGNARKKDGFWCEVLAYIESKTKIKGRRTYDMVMGKWKTVRPAVVWFCGVYGNVMSMTQESGAGDGDYVQKAMIHYQAETGLPFKFRSEGSSKRHKSSGSSSFNTESEDASINLNTTVVDGDELTAAEVQQREAFIEIKRREVKCREREVAATEYRAQQEDISHQDYVSQTQMGGSSLQPRTDPPRSLINAFSIEELYTPEFSESLQENTDYWQEHNPYEAIGEQVATSPTKKKNKTTRNCQKRTIQTDDAPRQIAWTSEEEIVLAKCWRAI